MDDPGDIDIDAKLQATVEVEVLLYETNEFSIIMLTDEELEATNI